MKTKNNLKKGFTLLETLIAIFILTLSITGPVYIASVAFRNTIDSRDNISAQYIAEEIIEVIRNKRDKNALTLKVLSHTWVVDLNLGSGVTCLNDADIIINKCTMEKDFSSGEYTFENCTGGTCPNISFDPSKDIVYGQSDASTFSKFTREFYFEKETFDMSSNLTSIKIVVNIKWNDRGRDKVYTLEERLYNTNYHQYFIEDEE